MDNSPGPRSQDRVPRSSNLETGLLMLFGNRLWVLFEGVGAMVGRSAAHAHRFYDGLAKAVGCGFILVIVYEKMR